MGKTMVRYVSGVGERGVRMVGDPRRRRCCARARRRRPGPRGCRPRSARGSRRGSPHARAGGPPAQHVAHRDARAADHGAVAAQAPHHRDDARLGGLAGRTGGGGPVVPGRWRAAGRTGSGRRHPAPCPTPARHPRGRWTTGREEEARGSADGGVRGRPPRPGDPGRPPQSAATRASAEPPRPCRRLRAVGDVGEARPGCVIGPGRMATGRAGDRSHGGDAAGPGPGGGTGRRVRRRRTGRSGTPPATALERDVRRRLPIAPSTRRAHAGPSASRRRPAPRDRPHPFSGPRRPRGAQAQVAAAPRRPRAGRPRGREAGVRDGAAGRGAGRGEQDGRAGQGAGLPAGRGRAPGAGRERSRRPGPPPR